MLTFIIINTIIIIIIVMCCNEPITKKMRTVMHYTVNIRTVLNK